MRPFLDLLKRELRLITTDHTLLLTLLIAPVLYAFFYGSIYINKAESEVKIAVVDADGSALSRMISEQLNATSLADVVPVADLQEAQQKMYGGDVQGYCYIENGLEQKVLALQQANVVLALNASRFLPSSDLTATVTKICLTLGAGVRLNYFKRKGNTNDIALEEANPVRLNEKPLYNESGSYGGFLLPGLLALILQQTLLIGLAESMSSEREQKRLSQMLCTGRGSLSAILWGKGLWYFLLFGCYAFFFMTVNFQVLHLPFRGSALDIGMLLALFLVTLIPLGLTIGSLFKSQILSMQVMAFSTYPIFLITGYSMPYQSLPKLVQWISALLPTTPFLKAYTSIVQTGGNLHDNRGAVVHLLLLWLLFCGLFLWRFRRLEKKERIKNLAMRSGLRPGESYR